MIYLAAKFHLMCKNVHEKILTFKKIIFTHRIFLLILLINGEP